MDPNDGLTFLGERRGYRLFQGPGHRYLVLVKGELRPLVSVSELVGHLAKPGLPAWAAREAVRRVREGYRPGMPLEDFHALLEEAAGEHQRAATEAASKGTSAHAWIEAHLRGESPPLPDDPRVLPSLEAYLAWWQKRRPVPLLSERPVAHVPLGFAGRPDLLLQDGTLVDFKTSKTVYPEHALQLGGYALALEWWEGVRPKRGLVVRIGKDGSLEERPVDLERAREAFLSLLEVARFVRGFQGE